MCLVDKEAVHAQLFKGHNIVLRGAVQLFQPCLQGPFRALQLLDAEFLRAAFLQFLDARFDLRDLVFQKMLPPLIGHGQALKLRVAHDDRVIIAGGNAGAELLAIRFFKVLFGGDEDICRGIEAQELRRPLFYQVVRYGKEGFLTEAQALAFHRGGDHLKGLARAHLMRQQRIPAVEDMSDGVKLMLPQSDFRVDAAERDVPSVVLAGTGGIELLVIPLDKLMPPLRVLPHPIPKGILDGLLLLLGERRFLLVEDTALLAVQLLDRVVDTHVAEIQRVLQNAVGVGAVRAVGRVRHHVPRGGLGFSADAPFRGVGGEVHTNMTSEVIRGLKGFVHELLNVFLIHPRRAQAHVDL